jgi:hypothetical protein
VQGASLGPKAPQRLVGEGSKKALLRLYARLVRVVNTQRPGRNFPGLRGQGRAEAGSAAQRQCCAAIVSQWSSMSKMWALFGRGASRPRRVRGLLGPAEESTQRNCRRVCETARDTRAGASIPRRFFNSPFFPFLFHSSLIPFSSEALDPVGPDRGQHDANDERAHSPIFPLSGTHQLPPHGQKHHQLRGQHQRNDDAPLDGNARALVTWRSGAQKILPLAYTRRAPPLSTHRSHAAAQKPKPPAARQRVPSPA